MSEISLLDKYKNWVQTNEGKINTYANDLIVVFAFSVPLLISVRRLSISLILLLFLIRGRLLHHTMQVMRDPLLASLILYFLVYLIWTFGSDDLVLAKKSIHDAAFLLIAPVFATFIDRRYISRIAYAFVFGMFLSSLISFGIYFEILPAMSHNSSHGGVSDPTPVYHHTPYGYMLAITSVILMSALVHLQDNKYKPILYLFITSITLNIFIIEGPSGFVIFSILVLMMMILIYKRKAIKPLIITVTILGISTVFA